MQVGLEEWEIVVAAILDNDVRLRLGLLQDRLIVNAAKHDIAKRKVRFILLALLGRTTRGIQICARGEALHAFLLEITIRHRMTHQGRPQPGKEGALTTAEREELVRLRRQLRQVEQERDILVKATAWFAARHDKTSTGSSNS